ncbi:MAG: winged helix-turn-helix domain-containing protein [Thermoflexales bacterium]|nr:winged helix-turn-helix domain-containing protein [Thermoflexales bacterium]
MRTLGNNRQVDERRQRGLALLRDGLSAKQVASRLGASVRTVQRWAKAAKAGKPRARKRPGPKPRLKVQQVQRLARQLKRGARAHGYAEDHWTLDRIAHLIWTLFGVRFHPSGVWWVLQRMGWSSQKPIRQAVQRDDAAIECWIETDWPRIKKVARVGRDAGV